MNTATDWANRSGDSWAERWRATDRALAGLGVELLPPILAAAPVGAFRALELGCGAGATTLDLAKARPESQILACDLSPALAAVAVERLHALPSVEVAVGKAEEVAADRRPFDLLYSRHGVMFFEDSVRAFSALRQAALPGGQLVFSCFAEWRANPWACELAETVAGRAVPVPGTEPGGFAFADPAHVEAILGASAWADFRAERVQFDYVVGEGEGAADEALSYLAEIGPAASLLRSLSPQEREPALDRLRRALEHRRSGGRIAFPAAVWIWTAMALVPGSA